MTNSVSYHQPHPCYSGVTINVTNPMMNTSPTGSYNCAYQPCNHPQCLNPEYQQPNYTVPQNENTQFLPVNSGISNTTPINSVQNTEVSPVNKAEEKNQVQSNIESAKSYPPQYYMNNYNYVQNGEKIQAGFTEENSKATSPEALENVTPKNNITQSSVPEQNEIKTDLSSSKEIIGNIDSKIAEKKDLEKNGKQERVVALTNEYIMSLENCLNNPNEEIRITAAKEILTRLDEDKSRYDDAALNALLNKMLQDPEKIVRIAALSALSSQLASGNDYTVKLLTNIQQNPNSDKEDVVEAAGILLKMSADTELKYSPAKKD